MSWRDEGDDHTTIRTPASIPAVVSSRVSSAEKNAIPELPPGQRSSTMSPPTELPPSPPFLRDLLDGKSAAERKTYPIYRGVLKYFPNAIAEVAHVSYIGNEAHNPGQPMHWARGKSTDQEDCLVRHLLAAGTFDGDGLRHTAKVAWRALAMLELEIERDNARRIEEGKMDSSISDVG